MNLHKSYYIKCINIFHYDISVYISMPVQYSYWFKKKKKVIFFNIENIFPSTVKNIYKYILLLFVI